MKNYKLLSNAEELGEYMGVDAEVSESALHSGLIPFATIKRSNSEKYYTTKSLVDYGGWRLNKMLGTSNKPLGDILKEGRAESGMYENSVHNAKVVCISNLKGGVGKTTYAVNLASSLRLLKQKVLLVDMDHQGNTSSYFSNYDGDITVSMLIEKYRDSKKIEKSEVLDCIDVVMEDGVGDISILRSDIWLSSTLDSCITNRKRGEILDIILSLVKDEFDFIIIDTPPAIGLTMEMSYIASDYISILARSDKNSLNGANIAIENIEDLNSDGCGGVLDAIIINGLDQRQKQQRHYYQLFLDLSDSMDIDERFYVISNSASIFQQSAEKNLTLYGFAGHNSKSMELAEPILEYAIFLIKRNSDG